MAPRQEQGRAIYRLSRLTLSLIGGTPDSVKALVNPIPDGPRRAGKKEPAVLPLLGFPGLDFRFVLEALLACLGPPLAGA